MFLAATYVQLGLQDDAEWEVQELEVLHPELTLSHLRQTQPLSDAELQDRFVRDLRAAGLAE